MRSVLSEFPEGVPVARILLPLLLLAPVNAQEPQTDSPGVPADISPADLAFFEQKIRPVLVQHCYSCHAADSEKIRGGLLLDTAAGLLQGGDSGPALVPGDAAASLLLQSLQYEAFEMPPAGQLPDSVIADFATWIARGAADPRTRHNGRVPQASADPLAGRDHWAFQPLNVTATPDVQDSGWPLSWIDHYVLQKLESQNLTPAQDADQATLLRRLSFDLTGLPPTPQRIAEIAAADDPRGLESAIDTILESRSFAEHWARHWLDVARYADSNGGDFNATFHNAWRYRNYVINQFEQDRPLPEFIVEQIAGDLLPAADDASRERQVVATGLLMLGARMLSERDKAKLELDVVDEQISAVGKAFLGMTLECARCHDHKFDPIPTQDYYALAGIFRSTQTLDGEIQKYVSNWVRQPLPMTDAHRAALAEYTAAAADLKKSISALEKEVRDLEQNGDRARILAQGLLLDDDQAEKTGDWKFSTYSPNFIGKGYIHDDKQELGRRMLRFRFNVPADGEYEIRLAFPGSGGRATNVPVQIEHAAGTTTVLVDESRAAPILDMLKPLGRFPFHKGQEAVVEIVNRDTDGYVIVDALQIISAAELDQPADENTNAAKQSERLTALQQQLKQQQQQLSDLEKTAPAPEPRALAVRERDQPADSPIYIRGEHNNPGEIIPRGFLQVASWDGQPVVNPVQSGRLQLAEWIADARNPLTARVYVNRIWAHLMGAGLVRTVDNFGRNGEQPTHPELLDRLAAEFIAHNWSTRWLVREIVSSRTYRLSSAWQQHHWQTDPENRLHWRASRRPISAESIRDSLLQAAGELSTQIGEAPVAALGTLVTQNNADDKGVELSSNSTRTIYQPVIRNELPPLMTLFDFADPDFGIGQRTETVVPTQSLWMLNSDTIQKRAAQIADRVLAADFTDQRARIEFLYQLVLGRPPQPDEARLSIEFLSQQTDASHEDWADLTQAILASSAFRMLD